jgi:uncharacterized membrane protein SirB2
MLIGSRTVDSWPSWGALLGGAVASNVVLGIMLYWIRALAELFASRAPGAPKRALVAPVLAASLLNAGPWMLLVVAYFSFHISSQPWASSFFAGAAAWVVFVGILVAVGMAKIKRAKSKNAV